MFFHAWDIDEETIEWKNVSVWHANLRETEKGIEIE